MSLVQVANAPSYNFVGKAPQAQAAVPLGACPVRSYEGNTEVAAVWDVVQTHPITQELWTGT